MITGEQMEAYLRESIEASDKLSKMSRKRLISFAVTGLNEEAGEVSGLLTREEFKERVLPEEKWVEEIGDTLWYLVALITARGLTIEQVVDYNVEKLEERYGDKTWEQLTMPELDGLKEQ